MSTSLCSFAPEEKQTPSLPPPSPSSSSTGFLLLPPLPLGLFFYGRASNIWPLPCIRLHVSIQTRQYKKEQCTIKYTNFVCTYCFFSNFSMRWDHLPKSSPALSSKNWILIYPLQTHSYCNPIKQQPQRVRNHLCLVEIFIQLFSSSAHASSSGPSPLWIIWLAAVLCGMTSCNLVYTFTSFAWEAFALPATELNKLRRRLFSE